jgi:hypothetical protein
MLEDSSNGTHKEFRIIMSQERFFKLYRSMTEAKAGYR